MATVIVLVLVMVMVVVTVVVIMMVVVRIGGFGETMEVAEMSERMRREGFGEEGFGGKKGFEME